MLGKTEKGGQIVLGFFSILGMIDRMTIACKKHDPFATFAAAAISYIDQS